MTTYDWATIRADAIARFGGDAPRAELEARLIQTFQTQPQLVVLAIDKIADSYQRGTIRSPWAVLATHIERAAAPGADITADDTTSKLKTIQRVEQFIRAAGLHHDRESELLLDLFGDNGRLRDYAQIDLIPHPDPEIRWQLSEPRGDLALVDRMTALWHEHRPTGLKLEQDAQDRAEAWKQQQAARDEALAAAHAELAERQPVHAGPADPDPDDNLPL